MNSSGLEDIPNQTGSLVLGLNGSVQTASGEFEGNGEHVGRVVVNLLQDANSLIQNSTAKAGASDPFKRLTVTFTSFSYVIALTDSAIYVVKVNKA
eukprot:TRINITY_DN6998_c0_g1_i1.p1 TRINITY_DN6998_c0_g1~~TRINITY_DN6998_c0_g1_i1.p1  ORF type:complete len:111 (-),score=6.87 TRINITY_DN6998_c0_g1_i1:210-497(-)